MARIGVFAVLVTCLLSTGTAAAGYDVMGLWHLDEVGGYRAVDSSGQGNDGTLSGGVTWVAGHAGGALAFDGSDGRVTIPDSPSLEPAGAITVSAWIRRLASPGRYRYVVAKGVNGCLTASYGLYADSGGAAAFYVATGPSSYVISPEAPESVWDGTWHQLTGTFDGSVVRLYVDGAQVGTGTADSAPIFYRLSDSNSLFIGDYPAPTDQPACHAGAFSGAIDEVMVLGRALSAGEVGALWAAPASTAPTASQPSAQTGQATGAQPGATQGNGADPERGTNAQLGSIPGTTGPAGSALAPRLRALRLSPAAFALAGTGAAGGTTVTYIDTETATVTFSVLREQIGHLRGGRCLPGRGRGRRCARWTALGTFQHADRAGLNRFRLWRLPRTALPPGSYRLQAIPTGPGGKGAAISAGFRVLAARHAPRH